MGHFPWRTVSHNQISEMQFFHFHGEISPLGDPLSRSPYHEAGKPFFPFLALPFPRFTCVLLVNIGHLFSGEYIALTFMTNLHLCISSCDISPISDPSHGPPFAPREVRRCSGTCRALCGQQVGR